MVDVRNDGHVLRGGLGGCIEEEEGKSETKMRSRNSIESSSPSKEMGDRRESAKKAKGRNIGGRGEQACWTLFLLSTAPLHGRRRHSSVAFGRKRERRQQKEEVHPEKLQARGGFRAKKRKKKRKASRRRRRSPLDNNSKNKFALQAAFPSAHPDVALLVHQGTDLVNREPVGWREGRKEGVEEVKGEDAGG